MLANLRGNWDEGASRNEVEMAGIEKSILDSASEISSAFRRIQEWVQRMTSGQRIASAKDDPAGLGIREELRASIAEIRQGSNNLTDGLSIVQTADSAASQIHTNLVRMKELATQASTGTFSVEQKQIMQNEFNHLASENEQIVRDATFNGIPILSNQNIGIHYGKNESIMIPTQPIDSVQGDLLSESIRTSEMIETAIQKISSYRGSLGSTGHRFEKAAEVKDMEAENLIQAESRISDLDMAQAAASKLSQDIITQSALASQVHADSFAEVILKILG